MCDIKECRASERGWRRSCGDRGIHRAGENARRVGESSRGNWYVRVGGYADTVSPVKMREFRRNYLHHGNSKTFLLVREKDTRIDLKDRRAHVPARARILTCVLAWVPASAVHNALGCSLSTQCGTGPDPVVVNRASTARHMWPPWGIVGQAEKGRCCIACAPIPLPQ